MNNYELTSSLVTPLITNIQVERKRLTQDDIRTVVGRVNGSGMVEPLTDDELEKLIRELESRYQTVIGAERDLLGDDDDGWEPWLRDRSGTLGWHYSGRYTEFLKYRSLSESVLQRMNSSTDTILGYLGDPMRDGPWDRRGLVVGLVQSGKTANYLGLINKAIDTGYKVIVILTGFTESLRSQTQIRIESGVLGYAITSDPNKRGDLKVTRKGVGLLGDTPIRVDSVTTTNDDFKTGIARNLGINIGGNPIVFVVKKNATVLRNLLNWVRNFGDAQDADGRAFVRKAPLLLVDDESDVGSVDTKNGTVDYLGDPDLDHDPSKINKQIRKLLSLFDKSSYVGYTATPFANVLIHDLGKAGVDPEDTLLIGEDLFPRSFIVSLPTPSSHVGPTMMFGTDDSDGLPVLRIVDDVERGVSRSDFWMPGSHKPGHVPRYEGEDRVPPSLREALLSFILVCAARRLRGDIEAHNSMLIHVTRFVAVQERVYGQVERELRGVVDRLRSGTAAAPLLDELRALWEHDADSFTATTRQICAQDPGRIILQNPNHEWADICAELLRAADSIVVRPIHGTSGEVLDYEQHTKGLNVIAIGGDKLARGLTLEGLSVSYFLRASKMYDTLMQMGRWFGYRPGYLDLCRLFTTTDMCEWFGHISQATEELREEFVRMSIMRRTPKDFGLRIRSHSQMMVTSAVKMRHGTRRQVSFDGNIVETIDFSRRSSSLITNLEAGSRLLSALQQGRGARQTSRAKSGSVVWADVPASLVMEFLSGYREHEAARKVKTSLLRMYIERETKKNRLTQWCVLLASGDSKDAHSFGDISVPLIRRAWYLGRSDSDEERDRLKRELISDDHYRIRRLVSPMDETAGLSQGQIDTALALDIERWEADSAAKSRPTVPSGPALRRVRGETNGLLMLYPMSADDQKAESEDTPILGFAISFPTVASGQPSQVEYVVNNIYESELVTE